VKALAGPERNFRKKPYPELLKPSDGKNLLDAVCALDKPLK
jgi:hypothetical protein